MAPFNNVFTSSMFLLFSERRNQRFGGLAQSLNKTQRNVNETFRRDIEIDSAE